MKARDRQGELQYHYRSYYGAGFIQDDFKVSSRLTVNLGLRWEYVGPALDTTGAIGNAWPSLLQQVPHSAALPARSSGIPWPRTTTPTWSTLTPASRSARRPPGCWFDPPTASTRTALRWTRSLRALVSPGSRWGPAAVLRCAAVTAGSTSRPHTAPTPPELLCSRRRPLPRGSPTRTPATISPASKRPSPPPRSASCRARPPRSYPTGWPARSTSFPGCINGT